ncbi:MAG TPA: hypothetical protein P5279_08180 [Anaerohalosphaeraceae bacterium]|jgi:hypothetical protein|nr:hypothetical protein [Anaerohalosphaeraceae bacterium]HRT50453.1 hypothetical protein [Anaerohalosphaeraceae bacterium]HRT86383.1 hypothetical protein [Anaerohalosphaeraceae bacterium]
MRSITTRKAVCYSIAVCLVLAAIAWLGLRGVIVNGLDEAIGRAQAAYPHPHDDVAALMDYVAAEGHSLRDRNSAVWAMGQLRDDRVLPVLRQFYTGGKCDHANAMCQRELKKAIDLCTKNVPDLLLVSKH